ATSPPHALHLVGRDPHMGNAEKKGRTPPGAKKLIQGYEFSTVSSALQNEIRRGDVEAAVYWGLLLYWAAPLYAFRRVLTAAAEDVGFGDPDVVAKVCSMAAAWKVAKEASFYVSPHLFTMSLVLLYRAQKSMWLEDLQTSISWPMRTDKKDTTGS